MLSGALNWFLSTRIGNWLAMAFGVLVLLGGVYLRGLLKGREDERVKRDRASLETLRNRKKVDEESNSMSAADRRKRLSGWVSDDE